MSSPMENSSSLAQDDADHRFPVAECPKSAHAFQTSSCASDTTTVVASAFTYCENWIDGVYIQELQSLPASFATLLLSYRLIL